ncbi:transporter substrate-binding domain-containing protein [Oxalicibacterium faecigallinarum]|uniref:Glutamate/aspartate ABC transporter substrate-binding protein n=1 Tax=Oxalicibacterium faecigallinarum TaxID=573741 RepID=A0A8J3AVQ9_9BURK|nr:transporter substrate-binding domain-containing protein [Oxalicibacterium faecigallinarum]GGI21103.1 glutamate/aspartate ABC transporter substrate-binding protein [Oxalicibacterium faecigallinarum]
MNWMKWCGVWAGAIACAGTMQVAQAQVPELTGTLKKINATGTLAIGYRETSIPFSYLDNRAEPIGYAIDLCMKIVDQVKLTLNRPDLKIRMLPVTSSNRIPLLRNGTIDLECGSTTNSKVRQKQVAFGPTYFLVNIRAAVKKSSGIETLAQLDNRAVAATSGTTSVALLRAHQRGKEMRLKEIYGKDHAESFLLMAEDRASAFVIDDILLAGQIANAKKPELYRILPESLRQEPYSMMLRRDDPQFKALVDKAVGDVMRSGEIYALYDKWFVQPIPPRRLNLHFPLTDALREQFQHPNDEGV